MCEVRTKGLVYILTELRHRSQPLYGSMSLELCPPETTSQRTSWGTSASMSDMLVPGSLPQEQGKNSYNPPLSMKLCTEHFELCIITSLQKPEEQA